jgi:hypothetical protein
MDETRCRRFFVEPTQTYQKQYEALRAVFVEGRCLKDVAEQFGYEYGSLRTIAYSFGSQLSAGQIPPFFRSLAEYDPQRSKSMSSPS